MCNFYMMYYTKEISADEQECWGMGVPHAESLFPSSADDLAPYPGFAGQGKMLLPARYTFCLLFHVRMSLQSIELGPS